MSTWFFICSLLRDIYSDAVLHFPSLSQHLPAPHHPATYAPYLSFLPFPILSRHAKTKVSIKNAPIFHVPLIFKTQKQDAKVQVPTQ